MPLLLTPGSARWPHLVDDAAVLQALLDVEVAWVRVQARLGLVDDDVVAAVSAHGDVTDHDLGPIAAGVEAGGNPVIPMLAALRAAVGPETRAAAVVHRGLTSQDVLDSALMLLAHRSLAIVVDRLGAALDAAARLADAHRGTLLVARTLSQPALPTTFAAKAAGWLAALHGARAGVAALTHLLPVQCGGAAGTLAAIDALAPGRALEAADLLAEELGLASAGRPWHTDRAPVTRLGDALVRATDALGKIAGDIILMSRPELGEVAEPAAEGRGGSSTLPQKRNPVLSILVRSVAIEAPHLAAALHSAAALASDERPDGAWHAEWRPLAALLGSVPVAAAQLADVLGGLEVHVDAMRRNVEAAGPALVAERLLRAVPALPGGADLAPALRSALRSGASHDEVHALLRHGLPSGAPPGGVPDGTIDDLLSPAAYVGLSDALVDRALQRHATPDQGGPLMPPTVTVTELRAGSAEADLLIVGPSLGTAVTPLWSDCAAALPGDVRVLGWDLPGHGRSAGTDEPITVGALAESVLAATESERNTAKGRVWYAGVSLGGTVGLQLAVDHGQAFDGVAILCSGAKIGEASAWHERADLVRRAGTPVMVEGSAQRWFAPGFLERNPRLGTALLNSLQDADKESYARCCEALADFDLRPRLGEAATPVLALAGAADPVTPAASAEEIASGTGGRAVVVDEASHLAPAEQPAAVAAILADFFRTEVSHATA